MKTIERMKKLSLIALVLCASMVAYAAYLADDLLGVVALTYGYPTFCLLTALAFGAGWRFCSGQSGITFGLVVFASLATNIVLPPSSDRILRSIMVTASPGTEASAIVDIVKQKYANSPYALPQIYQDRSGRFERVHVSLMSQEARSCTSVLFIIENGRVLRRDFLAD